MENTADVLKNCKEILKLEVFSEIERANRLADIAHKTTDREEFYNAIGEKENILTELSKCEHKFDFSYSPFANLSDLRRGRDKQIELLEKRIAEKEKENIKESALVSDTNTKYNYNNYYARIVKQKENNLQITYDDVKCYELRPFDLNKPFIFENNCEEPVQILCGFQEKQQNAITYHELRQAILDGTLSKETIELWKQDYSKLILGRLKGLWTNAVIAGASEQPILDDKTFVFNTQTPGVLKWIHERGAQLVTACTKEQKEAISTLIAKKMEGRSYC